MFFIVNEEIFYEAFGPLALPERKKNSQIGLYVTIMSRTRLRVNLPVVFVYQLSSCGFKPRCCQ